MKLIFLFLFALFSIQARAAESKTLAFYLRMADLGGTADASCAKSTVDMKSAACSANASGVDREVLVKQGQEPVLIWNGNLPNGEATSALIKAKFYFQPKGALIELITEPGLDVEVIVPHKRQKLSYGHWQELAIANRNGKKTKIFGRILQKSLN